MSDSEEIMPRHHDSSDNGADNETVRTKIMEDHFLQTFHRLRVERYENQLRAEERKWQRIQMGSQRPNSIVGFDSTHRAEHTSPIHTIRNSRSSSSSSSSSSLEINEAGTSSARRELFHLGRRYASQRSRLQFSPSIITEDADAKDHHLKSKDLFPSPTCSSANIGPLEHKGGVVNESHQLFNSNTRSASGPIEIYNSGTFLVTPDDKSTPKEDIGIFGCHYLLLARANDSPVTMETINRNSNNENGSNVIDDNEEDRSDSSASSAPHLQAASACNSHGEQDDSGCEDNHSCGEQQQGDVNMKKLDHFSSFCRAQVLISEIEHKSTRPQQEEESPACEETDTINCNSMQPKKKCKIKLFIHSLLGAVALAAICLGLRYITSWYKLAYPDWSLRDVVAAQYHKRIRLLQWIHLSARTLKNTLQSRLIGALSQTVLMCNHVANHLKIWLKTLWGVLRLMHSKVDDGYEQVLLLRNHAASNLTHWTESLLGKIISMYTNWQTYMADTLEEIILFRDHVTSHATLWIRSALDVPRLIHLEMMNRLDKISLLWNHVASSLALCAKSILNKPINAYTNWRNNFDIVSFIIVRIYRIEKIYYELLEMLNVTKHRMVEVQQSSILAWNMTLSTAISFWQQLKSVQAFNHTTKSFNTQEDSIIRRSAITRTPLIFWSLDGDGGMSKTSVNETLSQLVAGDATKIEDSMSPHFWRGIVKGTPFVKQTRHRCIHNIPSLAPLLEAGQTSSFIGSSGLSGLWNQSSLSYPLVHLRHPRLSLDNQHLESVVISSDIRENMATSLVVQKAMAPKQQPSSQAIKPEKRNYYVSSYPLEMQSHEKDVFDNVDVMEMAREFMGKVLQRKQSRRGSHAVDNSYA